MGMIKNTVFGKEYKKSSIKSVKLSFTTWLDPAMVMSKITEETKNKTVNNEKKNCPKALKK